MHPIDEHLDEFIARFAREDHTTPDEWKRGAIRQIVAERATGEAVWNHSEYIRVEGFASDEAPT